MEKKLIGIKELAALLGISVNTLYSWVWQRKIPCYKLSGRMVKFDIKEIEEWLMAHREAANPKWEVVDGKGGI